MKTKTSFPTLILCALAFIFPALAYGATYSSGQGDANGTASTAYVASAARSGTPVLQYLSASSDLSTSKVTIYTAGPSVLVTGTSAASGTNIVTAGGTNTFTTGDVIVLRSVGADLYQKTTVGVVTATNITTGSALTRALSAGDVLYKMTADATIPVGAATVSVLGDSYAGGLGGPLLFICDGTTNARLNTVTVAYK